MSVFEQYEDDMTCLILSNRMARTHETFNPFLIYSLFHNKEAEHPG